MTKSGGKALPRLWQNRQ